MPSAESGSQASAHARNLAAVIARIAGGDQGAVGHLYDETSPLVYGLARRILRDDSAADEIAVEVYTQAYQQAWRYDPRRGTPLAWMLTMTRSRALSRLRRDVRRGTREMPIEQGPDLASEAPNPDEFSAAAETRRAVVKAMSALPADQRRAIELAYYLGLSHSEIAGRLRQPLGTVKTHIRRGMMLLREHLT